MEQHEAEVAQLARTETLELGGGCPRIASAHFIGFVDERADNESLATGAQLFADPLVGPLTSTRTGDDVRLDWATAQR